MNHLAGIIPSLISAVLLGPTVGEAQRQAPHLPTGFAAGLSVDHLVWPTSELNLGTLHLSDLHPGGVGYEASFSFARGGGALIDMDIMQCAPLESSLVLIRAGAGFGMASLDVNGGLGVVVPVSDQLALRGDATVRALLIDFPHYSIITLGIGLLYNPTSETGS